MYIYKYNYQINIMCHNVCNVPVHAQIDTDVMYDTKSDRPRCHTSSAKAVANPCMYYFKGMKYLSSILTTQSDLIDIEL